MLWQALAFWLLTEVMIIHLFVSDIQLPLYSSITAQPTKALPPVIALSSLHFSSSLFRLAPRKAGMSGIINTNLWNSLWRWEASIWIWLILDTLREYYHHKPKAICLIDISVNIHTHISRIKGQNTQIPEDWIQKMWAHYYWPGCAMKFKADM